MTATGTATRELTYRGAFNEGLRQVMREDPDVFVAGEDVGAPGGVFGTFAGLADEFGERRAVDTPISEQAIVGLGIGAAVVGLRPVIDLMFMDFVLVAMDQIANQAAKLKYMFGGTAQLPLTITTAGGAGLSAAAQHSQSLEAILAHVPGLKVVMPSSAADFKGLLKAAVRDDNPVLFFMDLALGFETGEVPDGDHLVPLGKSATLRTGTDVALISYAKTVHTCIDAARRLADHGISSEVLDLRSLKPLDEAAILATARKTGRVIVVHEASRSCGIGAEVAALIAEHAFDALKAPVLRLTGPDAPAPASWPLEQAFVPQADAIVAAASRLVKHQERVTEPA